METNDLVPSGAQEKVQYSKSDLRPRNNNHRIISPRARTLQVERVCEECGNSFKAKTSTARFCSSKCNQQNCYRRRKGTKTQKSPKEASKETILASFRQDSDLLTVKQFAEKLGVCKQTIYNISENKQVRIIRFTQRLSYICWPEFMTSLNEKPAHSLQSRNPNYHKTSSPQVKNPNPNPPLTPTLPTSPAVSNLNPDQWIDKKGACERYNLTPSSFFCFVSTKKIPKQKVNGKLLFSLPEMDKTRNYHVLIGYITVAYAQEKYNFPSSTI